MTDFEALMWRAEVDPRLRSDAVFLDILDKAPDWDRLVSAHEWGSRVAPRLRQRVVEDVLRLRPPAWVPTELDLGYHLSRVRLADGDGMGRLMDLASVLYMTPFDPARPLWQALLVEGLPGGQAAYMLKVHHAMTDGQGAIQLFGLLHSHTAEPSAKPMPAPEPAGSTGALGLGIRRSSLNRDSVVGGTRAAQRLGISALRTLSRPQSVPAALSYAQSLGRVTRSHGTPSPLLSSRGLARRMRIIEIPLAELRTGGRTAGGTLNDAYLAGLVGGLRYYHQHHGVEVGDLPIGFPVSLRRPEHGLGGNQFGGATIAGPSSEPDPASRIKLVRERVLGVRDEPALNFIAAGSSVLSRLPGQVLAGMTLRFTRSIDMQASNIPGLNRPAYIAGSRILRMYGFGPVPGGAIMATLLSHEGVCCIAISTDNDAVPDPDVLAACFEKGLREICALAEEAL